MCHLQRARRVLVLALLAVAATVSSAQAAPSAVVTVAADPVEDVPFAVTISGESGGTADLRAYVLPAGAPCDVLRAEGPTPEEPIAPTFTLNRVITATDPGSYVLCAELGHWFTGWTVVARQPFSVRRPHGTIAVSAPAVVAPGERFDVRLAGSSELSEQVFLTTKDSLDCGTHPWSSPTALDAVQGPFSLVAQSAIAREGRVMLCAYLQADDDDGPAVAVGRASVLVSSACGGARRRVGRARERLRAARVTHRLVGRRMRQLGQAKRAERSACRA